MNKSITEVEIMDEIPLEQTIENTLVKHNVTEAVINSLKEKYGSLRLKSLDDKESYVELKEAKKNVRKIGILTEKLCEEGRADAVKVQKLWLAKQKEVLAKIAGIENPIQADIDRYDAEVKRKEDEIERLKQEESIKRQQILTKMGATYADGCFTLASTSYEANIIKDADVEMWNDVILPKYDREYQKIEAVRIEQECLKAEQEEKLRKEREEFEAQQRAFKEQQDAFKKQQEEAERIRLEGERLEREKNMAAQRQQEQAQLALQQKRMQIIAPFNPYNKGVNVTELWNLSEEGFISLVADTKSKYEFEQAEKQKAIEAAAAEKERFRIEEEQRLAEIKRQQEEQRKLEEAAKANDKTKWESLLKQFSLIGLPEMKSGIYKGKIAILREKLEEINSL